MSNLPGGTRVLFIDVRHGDVLVVDGGRVRLRLEKKSGQVARLRIERLEEVVVQMQPGHKPANPSNPLCSKPALGLGSVIGLSPTFKTRNSV